jgi:hypothetical protein
VTSAKCPACGAVHDCRPPPVKPDRHLRWVEEPAPWLGEDRVVYRLRRTAIAAGARVGACMGAVYDSGDDGWSWGIGGRNRWGSKGYGWCPTEAAARAALVAAVTARGWVVLDDDCDDCEADREE